MTEIWRKIIQKAKLEYGQIKKIPCLALNMEPIYFDERGFNHLLMKNGRYRTKKEQIRRTKLIRIIPETLAKISQFEKIHYSIKNRSQATFWTLASKIKNKKIIIIIRQINNGRKHFFSIMDKNLPKSAQTP